jgi:hypothetical protein
MRLRHLLLTLLFATSAIAQTATEPTMQQQITQMLTKQKNNKALGSALAVGTLLGCTKKQAGKEATQSFYKQALSIGKTIEGYCKEGDKTSAKTMLLSSLDAKKSDPVLKTALGCYESQAASLAGMIGEKHASKAAFYARWVRNPAIAREEIKTTDICK